MQKEVICVGMCLKPFIGNPVHLTLRGLYGKDDEIFGFLDYNGRKYSIRGNKRFMEFYLSDVIRILPFNRLRNYFKDMLKTL